MLTNGKHKLDLVNRIYLVPARQNFAKEIAAAWCFSARLVSRLASTQSPGNDILIFISLSALEGDDTTSQPG